MDQIPARRHLPQLRPDPISRSGPHLAPSGTEDLQATLAQLNQQPGPGPFHHHGLHLLAHPALQALQQPVALGRTGDFSGGFPRPGRVLQAALQLLPGVLRNPARDESGQLLVHQQIRAPVEGPADGRAPLAFGNGFDLQHGPGQVLFLRVRQDRIVLVALDQVFSGGRLDLVDGRDPLPDAEFPHQGPGQQNQLLADQPRGRVCFQPLQRDLSLPDLQVPFGLRQNHLTPPLALATAGQGQIPQPAQVPVDGEQGLDFFPVEHPARADPPQADRKTPDLPVPVAAQLHGEGRSAGGRGQAGRRAQGRRQQWDGLIRQVQGVAALHGFVQHLSAVLEQERGRGQVDSDPVPEKGPADAEGLLAHPAVQGQAVYPPPPPAAAPPGRCRPRGVLGFAQSPGREAHGHLVAEEIQVLVRVPVPQLDQHLEGGQRAVQMGPLHQLRGLLGPLALRPEEGRLLQQVDGLPGPFGPRGRVAVGHLPQPGGGLFLLSGALLLLTGGPVVRFHHFGRQGNEKLPVAGEKAALVQGPGQRGPGIAVRLLNKVEIDHLVQGPLPAALLGGDLPQGPQIERLLHPLPALVDLAQRPDDFAALPQLDPLGRQIDDLAGPDPALPALLIQDPQPSRPGRGDPHHATPVASPPEEFDHAAGMVDGPGWVLFQQGLGHLGPQVGITALQQVAVPGFHDSILLY